VAERRDGKSERKVQDAEFTRRQTNDGKGYHRRDEQKVGDGGGFDYQQITGINKESPKIERSKT
jgi:hypothetical protein